MRCNIIVLLSLIINCYCSSLCDSDAQMFCVCRFDSKIKQDYVGEEIDCSYNPNVLETNSTLPPIVSSLNLSWNNLTSVKSSNLLKSNTLKQLILSNNEVTNISADAFELPELKTLHLDCNRLEYIDENTFRNIKKLEYLNLANNKFSTFAKLTFHHLSNLNEIILDNNNIGPTLLEKNIFDRNGFGLTNRIKTLSISGINLNHVPDNFFVEAYDIRKLIISNNKLTDIFELPFTLQYLDLSDNPIKIISSEDFSDVPALKALFLNNLAIKEVPEYAFEPLHGLTKLYLERNRNLTRFSALAFGQDVLDDADDFALEEFSLRGSRLKMLDEQLLMPFGQLYKLDLQGNPWICNCKIVWLKKLQISPKDYDHLRCGSPTSLFNARIFELDSKYFACPINKHYTGIAIAVVSFCLVLTTIAMWLFIFLPKYQSRSHILRNMYIPSTSYTILSANSNYP